MTATIAVIGGFLVVLGTILAAMSRKRGRTLKAFGLDGCGLVIAAVGAVPLLLGLGLTLDNTALTASGLALILAIAAGCAVIAWDTYWR